MADENMHVPINASKARSLPPFAPIDSTWSSAAPDADAELIEKILQKSEEGKITWSRGRSGHSGRLADLSMQIELTDSETPLLLGKTWGTFAVSRQGEQILVIDNEPKGLLALAGMRASVAHRKVTELKSFLETARVRQVRSVLADLDRI